MVASDIIPENEDKRIAVLRRYQILDTPPDGAFDRITAIAAHLFNTPIAIASLVDTDRIWFKSHYGIENNQIDRVPGLCASAIMRDVPYIVKDAIYDPRTIANPLVAGKFGLRFYAGIPLKTYDGFNLGTLCVIDFKPRQVTNTEIEMLSDLSQVIVDQMELRLSARRVDALNQQLKITQEKQKIKAMHDSLTGIWNRGAVMEFLKKSLALSRRESRSLATIMLDIDFFKRINDTFGHQAGDKVIVEISNRLQKNCRESDMVGRIGGEEFLIVMYPCTDKQAKISAKRFYNSIIQKPIKINSKGVKEIYVTISGGIFITSETSEKLDATTVLRYVDERLYQAKEKGRNRIF